MDSPVVPTTSDFRPIFIPNGQGLPTTVLIPKEPTTLVLPNEPGIPSFSTDYPSTVVIPNGLMLPTTTNPSTSTAISTTTDTAKTERSGRCATDRTVDLNKLTGILREQVVAKLSFELEKLANSGVILRHGGKLLPANQISSTSGTNGSGRGRPSTRESPRAVACKVCKKMYSSQGSLKTHLKTHHSKTKPHKCDYCSKNFALKHYLEAHVRTHTGEKPFMCTLCYKSYSSKSSLNTHMKAKHSTERPYKCSECEKEFAVKSYLDSHLKTHTGMKPYSCEQCLSFFSSKSSLNTHNKMFHGQV